MRKMSFAALAAAIIVAAPQANADESNLGSGGAAFLSRLLQAAPLSIVGPGQVLPNVHRAPLELPHVPHFGLSRGAFGGADGIFYSPSAGVELTAKPSLRSGLQGEIGITFRF